MIALMAKMNSFLRLDCLFTSPSYGLVKPQLQKGVDHESSKRTHGVYLSLSIHKYRYRLSWETYFKQFNWHCERSEGMTVQVPF